MCTYVKKIAYPMFMLSLLMLSYLAPLLSVITANADTEENPKTILFQNEKGTAQVTSLPDPTTGEITWTIEVEKNQQSAANQLAFSLSEGEQTVLPESIQSNGTPFTYDPQRQQLMEESTSSSFSQMTLTFQTKALETLTIKSAFLQTEEENGQVKEDIINSTDVAVVLPENESTEATSAEAVLADSQEQTGASEKQPATKSSESQPQAESTTASTAIESPLNTQASAPAASKLSSGGSFKNDVPEVDDVLLGEAQFFHIFANHATLNTHTNGNLAVGELNGNVNFGTSIQDGSLATEINYIQKVNTIANSSFVSGTDSRKNKVVFGPSVTVDLADQNQQPAVFVNGQRMDHLKTSEVFQDQSASEPYIDFKKVFSTLQATSERLGAYPQTPGVTKDFTDNNQRVINTARAENDTQEVVLTLTDEQGNPLDDGVYELQNKKTHKEVDEEVTNDDGQVIETDLPEGDYSFVETEAPDGYLIDKKPISFSADTIDEEDQKVVVTLSKTELEKDTPITIKGLTKGTSPVLINVDTEGASTVNIKSQIKLEYTDGMMRNSHETEAFDDAVILWNFINQPENQMISINSPFQGTILAVGDTVDVHQNVDGSIIADTVLVNAETHRWDLQANETVVPIIKLAAMNHLLSLDTTTVSGTKTWDDYDNKFNTRPTSITVQLLQNGEVFQTKTVTQNKEGEWHYEFTDLPTTDESGQTYDYAIQETPVEGYTTKVNGYDLVNTYRNTETTKVSGTKTWNDYENKFNTRPESITVDLMQNGKEIDKQIVKAVNQGDWTYRFDNLPKYDAEGKAYTYTIQEADVSGYISEVNGYDLVNTETTTVSGRKTWNDNDNQFNTRPENITVKLMRNGEKYAEKNVKSDNHGNWTYRFDNLPKYAAKGKAYTYTIQEENVPGYISEVNGYDLVNTETTTVSGRKTWNDNDNQFNTRPESITVKLMRNGEKYAEKNVKSDNHGNWTYRFDKLPKYDAEGKAYTYTIQEEKVSGYTTKVNGYDLVNTYRNTETTEVSGTKTWNDYDNKFNTRPESITVKLMQNGEKYAEKIVKADKKGNWTYRFDDLPKYDAEGKAYTYRIQEGKVPDYTTKINGYNLVNTYTGPETPKTPSDPKKPQVPLSPKKPDTSKQPEDDNKNDANHATTEKRLPKTNERSSYVWSILGSILLVTSVGMLYRRKHS
ncbi:Cna B-type domain-containing protein [Enterococcus casseliflavus]|uniref:Cna B-type domain-containing protein n=2 Tax=Enterococcus TaxID=1350 RepID=UPI0018840F91|nr:Cna B-type domain-containing protein [Enterococcus casseliflavus]MBE9897339.1 Cna B-type domain-containing protein [Enterococcus casseliflavus]MBE9900626.1 Cna B-type domain-containing protein [Enterococcus casseliflavus]MBE9921032.1 Cna B-type domain-containing protein [Enterococcus casseliflavus]